MDDFDRLLKKQTKVAMWVMIGMFLFYAVLFGFMGFVIIRVLQHFKVF